GEVAKPDVVLAELVDFDSLLFEVDVPEARLAGIAPGSPCRVTLDASPQLRVRAAVVAIPAPIHPAKGTGTVKGRLYQARGLVPPEMSGRAACATSRKPPAAHATVTLSHDPGPRSQRGDR